MVFFDVSGFYNGKCWLPREGALLGSTALSVFNLDHGQKLDCLSDTAKSNAMMTMERIGMFFEPPPKSITGHFPIGPESYLRGSQGNP